MKMKRTVAPLKKETGSFTRTVKPLMKQKVGQRVNDTKRLKQGVRDIKR